MITINVTGSCESERSELTRPSPSVPENDVIKAEYAYRYGGAKKVVFHQYYMFCVDVKPIRAEK